MLKVGGECLGHFDANEGAADSQIKKLLEIIESQKKELDEARDSMSFLDSLLENLPDMIFVKDAVDLKFLRFNKAGEQLLGYSRSDLIGKSDYDFFPKSEADAFIEKDRSVLTENEAVDIPEEKIHTKNGERILHTKKVPVYDNQGRARYLLGISEDISERKKAEEEIRRLYEKQKEIDASRARFFANLSHELRTPLSLIIGPTEKWLNSNTLNELQSSDAQLILRNAQRLLNTVNDLLDVAKLEDGKYVPHFQKIDASIIFKMTCSLFEERAQSLGIKLKIQSPKTLTAVIDPEMFQRIILNILSNAFKYAPQSKEIVCLLKSEKDNLSFTIQDQGSGIPTTLRDVIFERFKRIEDKNHSSGRGLGSGLGLAIIKELVLLQKGSVQVEEAVGGGALFKVSLPLKNEETSKDKASQKTTQENEWDAKVLKIHYLEESEAVQPFYRATMTDSDKALVLIVEDNADLNEFVSKGLSEHYRVATAFNGVQGLALARALKPDLILTDIMMPQMDGEKFLIALQSDAYLKDVPVIVLTAKADDELRVKLLEKGARDYVMKPFSIPEVLARCRNLVSIKKAKDFLQYELATQQDDVNELLQELSNQKKKIEKSLMAKEEFLSVASQELKAPLVPLITNLNILRTKLKVFSTDPRISSAFSIFEKSLKELDSMNAVVQEMIELSTGHSLGPEIKTEELELGQVVTELIEYMQDDIRNSKSTVDVKIQKPVWVIWDRKRLDQVLQTLISNACRHSPKSPVRITIASTKTKAIFKVQDNGKGLSKDGLRKLVRAFEKGELIENAGGFELGLSTIHKFVKSHGGSLQVESSLTKGSLYTLTLPLHLKFLNKLPQSSLIPDINKRF